MRWFKKKKQEDKILSVDNWVHSDLTDGEKAARGHAAGVLLKDDSFHTVMICLHQVLHSQLDSMETANEKPIIDVTMQIRALRSITRRLESWQQEAQRLNR